MKPCNFPERRNQRRIRAMARIVAAPGLYRHRGKGEQVKPVVLPSQRGVRTKKAGGKILRQSLYAIGRHRSEAA